MSNIIATGCNSKYFNSLKTLLASIFKYGNNIIESIHIYDLGLELNQIKELKCVKKVRILKLPIDLLNQYPHFNDPKNFAWKTYIIFNETKLNSNFLYIDSGACFVANFQEIFDIIHKDDIFLVQDTNNINKNWCHEISLQILHATNSEKLSFQLCAGIQGYKENGKYNNIAKEAFQFAQNKDCIEGDVKNHRHDQCIYSILTTRNQCPTQNLYRFGEWRGPINTPNQVIYVHRGQYKIFLKANNYNSYSSYIKFELFNLIQYRYKEFDKYIEEEIFELRKRIKKAIFGKL